MKISKDEIEKMNENTRKEFEKYDLPEQTMEDMDKFLKAKALDLETGEDDFLKFKFDMVYTSLKSNWVAGRISEAGFWKLIGLLREGY